MIFVGIFIVVMVIDMALLLELEDGQVLEKYLLGKIVLRTRAVTKRTAKMGIQS